MERKLQDTRDREKRQFDDLERTNQKKIQALNESLARKEQDIENLKRTLMELNEREA
jgi:hypothetical protein